MICKIYYIRDTFPTWKCLNSKTSSTWRIQVGKLLIIDWSLFSHFLSLFWSCQFRRLDSIQFFCSQANILAGCLLETRLILITHSIRLLLIWLCPFIAPRHGPHRKHSVFCWRGVFTASLPSNRRHSVVLLHFTGMCLPSRCLAMGIHVTVFYFT
jgi:hypothetical protein